MSIDMDGLAPLEAVIARERPGPEMWEVMELSLISAAVGTVTIAGRPSILHLNGNGMVHGGYVATILDSAMACAIQSTLPAGGALHDGGNEDIVPAPCLARWRSDRGHGRGAEHGTARGIRTGIPP